MLKSPKAAHSTKKKTSFMYDGGAAATKAAQTAPKVPSCCPYGAVSGVPAQIPAIGGLRAGLNAPKTLPPAAGEQEELLEGAL